MSTLSALLDICIHSQAGDCVVEYAPRYAQAASASPTANEAQKRELARSVAFYLDQARFLAGSAETNARILEGESWKYENSANPVLYLRRQVLAANILLSLDRYREANEASNKILSLIAALKNPEESRFYTAYALSDVIGTLLSINETERAYGIYTASGAFIAKSLPPSSVDKVAFRLTEAQLLQAVGDLASSERALDEAIATTRQIELEANVRDWLLGRALTLKAVVCVTRGDVACGRAAMQAHPHAALYAGAARRPADYEEVTYLAARALVNAADGKADPIAAEALKRPVALEQSGSVNDIAEAYRAAGAALALPAGQPRRAAMFEAGRGVVAAARRHPQGAFGSWWRPGAVDQVLITLALSQVGEARGEADADVAFALFQLAARSGPAFDTDALTVLSQARDDLQRRSIHQALRLRARRDRLERQELKRMAGRALSTPPKGEWLQHDAYPRLLFRDFAVRIAQADSALAKGVSASGANIVDLERFQASLRPDEAALAATPLGAAGMAYMCVRRDRAVAWVGPADFQQMKLDIRLLQAALTAGHAASDDLDSQYPVQSAVRLYDLFIRPFEACLKAGDHILWLPGVTAASLPLSALLTEAPPRRGEGYDLGAADWLVRRHAVSYAGSASMVVAARSGARSASDHFDFLGVGDPVLSGRTAAGEERGAILLRGVRGAPGLATLAALPETRDELEQSAKGFRTSRLLLQADATERRLRGELIGSYRYISFATHGLLRDDMEGLSEPALVLTPVASGEPADDGLLTASEIADLNLSALFVALSACNTANFDLTQLSQDLPALASAFAVAGVPATLATLWPVDSETSRRVVAAGFTGLRADQGPAEALAAAQRAFLAAPPSRAHLHPRFWAPFVVLGDGGRAPAPRAKDGARVVSVERLSGDGGEVVAVKKSGGETLVRLVGERGPDGRHGSGVGAVGPDGAVWRRGVPDIGATQALVELGDHVVAGGYRPLPQDRVAPILEVFDRRSGERAKVWDLSAAGGSDGLVYSGLKVAPRKALFIVGDPLPGEGRPPALQVFELEGSSAPRRLFSFAGPDGASITSAQLARLGDDLLIAYSDRIVPPSDPRPLVEDTYEANHCTSEPVTWLELRDARTGQLRASKTLRGYRVTSMLEGAVPILGGSFRDDCSKDLKSIIFSVDKALGLRPLFVDATLGASEVRAMSRLDAGATFVAAIKENVLDYKNEVESEAGDVPPSLDVYYAAMLFTLRKDGQATAPTMLDSGSNLFVAGADGDPRGMVLGGSIGGEAALIRLDLR